jgi:hypothetical protein
MRKKQYITFIFPVILLLLLSCREVYYPEGLNSGKAIPIIQGRIAEDESPTVVLSRAMDYESAVPDYISGAEVIVSDNKGNVVTLTESTPGHYVDAVRELFGIVGTAYKLHVKMEDGEEFESSMVIMPKKPIIDSLYAEPGTKKTHSYDQYSRPISVTYEGLYFSTSLSANGDSTLFYRFNTSALKESTCIRLPGTPSAMPMYIWEPSALDFIYSVDFTVNSAGRQVRPEHPIGFVRYFYDPSMATVIYSAPLIIGWVVTLKVIAISSDVYNYYQSVGTQLNSNDQMFAPVPSQVKSNIHCTTDPDLPVVGVFEASSSATYYKAFRWISMDTYEYINLESFPDNIQAGTKLNFPPSFWISFN